MDANINLTIDQCRRYVIYLNSLSGPYIYSGKSGVLKYIQKTGCIQFDPIDVCGKNPELVLQSRVKGFKKPMLYDLLYKDRSLIDYFDKQLSIMPVGDFKYFPRTRDENRKHTRSLCDIMSARDTIIQTIKEKGPVSSADIGLDDKVQWYWSSTRLSRAALEAMYFWGELAVSHKSGTNKYYDLIENLFEPHIYEDDYMQSDESFNRWRLLRRIKSVGILWNKPSDAFLGMSGFTMNVRNISFSSLLEDGMIMAFNVEGFKDKFYTWSGDFPLLTEIKEGFKPKKRCEFIAPLDNMMWDRKLIEALFGFYYRWEIYTPADKRKYAYYVLPVIYGDNFAGRVEMVKNKDKTAMEVKNFWPEKDFKETKAFCKAFVDTCQRFAGFNNLPLAYKEVL
ncbi:MAG: winged helix DNA-binding domain-containing protein [Clostridiales bacterium]|jgi:uncharacterized protein YcaQ|nr:winged helix DNA-binding domain-containing protein [Clostridiales bacterium]